MTNSSSTAVGNNSCFFIVHFDATMAKLANIKQKNQICVCSERYGFELN